jgi:uncharacterized membrane protein YkvA (DUF1232 family)
VHPLAGFYRWYRDTLRHSPYRWLLLLGSLLYLLSPIDFAPDVFPFLGWIDDGILIAILAGELASFWHREPQQPSKAPPEGVVVDVMAQEVKEDGAS